MRHLKGQLQIGAIAVAVIALAGTWTPAAAQPPSQPKVFEKISFGYKFYHVSQSEADGVNFPLGFYVDASGDIRMLPGWDWITEVTFAFRSETEEDDFEISERILFFGGGIKKEFENNPSFTPHFQFLVGLAHDSFSVTQDGEDYFDDSETVFAIKISGGIDYPINELWAIRAGAGYILGFHEDSNINIFRLFVGVVREL